METKICKECGITKDVEDFHIYNHNPDGYSSRCKPCVSIINKYRYEKSKSHSPLEMCEYPQQREQAEIILRRMGFELYNPDNPVYKQFDERMNTKYEK